MLILASNSPRRQQMLGLGGWVYQICAVEIDETVLPGEAPTVYVARLALAKARAAAAHLQRTRPELLSPTAWIVAADTTVVDAGQVLGKPQDAAEAEQILKRLGGAKHLGYTGLTILNPHADRNLSDICETVVQMRPYNDAEIRAYIATGDPLDKAGAYAIQHPIFRPVAAVEGCYANVVGLPLCHLARLLRQVGLPALPTLPQNCQEMFQHSCPVYSTILTVG